METHNRTKHERLLASGRKPYKVIHFASAAEKANAHINMTLEYDSGIEAMEPSYDNLISIARSSRSHG